MYKDDTFYKRAMARQAQMEADRSEWDSQREVIVEHFRLDITKYAAKSTSEVGKFLHDGVVEGTGAWSAGVMARGFTGSMVGSTLKWLRSVFSQMSYRGNDRLNEWLQHLDDYLLETTFKRSNFYEAIGPDVLDGITIGSPVMISEEDEKTGAIVCKCPHYKENYIMRDWFGNDVAYHRKFEADAINAALFFGRDNLPKDVQDSLKDGDHTKKSTYLMVIYHQDDPIFHDLKKHSGEKVSNIIYEPVPMRPWCLYYMPYACSDVRYQGALPAGAPGYFHKPFNAWHYYRNPNETYARTPAWQAIYDEKGGQSAWTSLYEVGEKAARRPLIALKEMKGNVKTAPGKVTWVEDDRQYDSPPKPLDENINYPHHADFVDRVDNKRKRHFHIDLFRMLDEYHREHKQPPTAYQISQMLAEKNLQIGPAISSFDKGLLGPIYERFIEIELRSGRLAKQVPPPPEFFDTDGDIVCQLIGPLAQAQKLAVTMRRIMEPLQMADYIFEKWPDSVNKIKPDILLEKLLEDSDFYQNALNSKEDYDQIIASLNMARQEMMNLEKFKLFADSASKLDNKDSPKPMLESA